MAHLAMRDPFSNDELKNEWGRRIDCATKLTGAKESYMVTVTDEWGGRGHDFRTLDEDVNGAGGALEAPPSKVSPPTLGPTHLPPPGYPAAPLHHQV